MLNKNGFGAPEVVTNSSAVVVLATFSAIGDVVEWINLADAPKAIAILTFTPTLVPAAGDTIKLYASRTNIDGSKGENFPSSTNKSILLATFDTDELAAEQTVAAEFDLANLKSDQGYMFAIESLLTTATIGITAGWTLTITAKG